MHRLQSAFCLLFLTAAAAPSTAIELTGPNGSVRVRLSTDADGHLVYSMSHDGRMRLAAARAGIVVDGVDLGADVTLGAAQTQKISETFAWRGGKSVAVNECLSSEIPMHTRAANRDWIFEVRVFNDGAAFRYRVPGLGKRHVSGETTCWQLPRDAVVWFQTDTSGYEGVYRSSRVDEIPLDETVNEKSQPTYFGPPVTIEFADRGLALLTEANLRDYSGLSLRPVGDAKLESAFVHDTGGWTHEGPTLSPWRVVAMSTDLDGLVNCDIVAALADPPDPEIFPEGANAKWIRPGKAPCTWMVYANDGAQWHRQKAFVDEAAAMGCEYLLVDAGWRSEKWGWLKAGGDVWARAAELCQYAQNRGVGIFLWHAFPDGRDDSPGLTTSEAREEFFENCRLSGVKGVKIDFFNSESRATVQACGDLLRRSARHRLMISLHGVYKPTGEARTWPHEITREGIREQEYVLWGSLPLSHYAALPFTRMAVGNADFLPGYVQPRFLKNTTRTFQMASVIVFSSPFLCWPDSPQAYLDSPYLQFVRSVPVTWDETRILPGSKIGDTVIMARRKGTDWYLAGLNCRSEQQRIDIDFSALRPAGDELIVYRDDDQGSGATIETALRPPESGRLSATLPAGGGYLAHFRKALPPIGTWK